ncbi:oligopeptidase A [Alkalimarinus alittae]|uniref:oligopeptidase A n=1 Tax=Alkalimarinus alittae TaxID=2961619 RepID=A0ABY6N1Y1_9ALTE|nr:oligopeptidase A [Alkalimarinus alittae]UZE96118.1 oligopeptidase A [Alkalimarinus alittae]
MTNPLLQASALPFFDLIKTEHVEPAIDQILQDNRQTIEQLTALDNISWDTLARPMEELENRLNDAWSAVSHLNAVVNDEALRDAYNNCLAKLTAYSTEVGQNKALCEAYKTIAKSDEFKTLDQQSRKSVENILRAFHLSGVDLDDDKKARYSELSNRLSELTSKFAENVLDATQGWFRHITDEKDLSGLPESAIAGARQAAEQKELDGFVITLDFPSYFPVMTYCDNRELRQEVYEAFLTRASDQGPNAGKWDNGPLIKEIMSLRYEQANILGFDSYADRSLAKKMASSTTEVLDFLNELAEKSKPVAENEVAELQAFAQAHGADQLKGGALQSWDLAYFGEKLRQNRYAISQEELRPYFPAHKVIEGMFGCVKRLFNIDIEVSDVASLWHPDVTYYVIKRDGAEIASFYLDLYARSNKRGGAWMADCRVRRKDANNKTIKPVAFLTCNFTPPVGDKPALLTHDEVTTLFHEFGHGLHHMLTKMDVYEVSGINGVAWDAVELPSQFLENWCWQPEALALISSHHETGEPLPKTLLDKMLAAKNFQAGMQMMRQLEFSLFDFRLHAEYSDSNPVDVADVLQDVRDKVAVLKPPAFTRFQNSFSHIFAGGYAAGYYSYKWAEVLAADAFSKFEEKGVFDQKTGQGFLQAILEQGGSREPMELFVEFRGREPSVEPLLHQTGII